MNHRSLSKPGEQDSLNVRQSLSLSGSELTYYSLPRFADATGVDITRLPYALRILLENLLRHEGCGTVTKEHILQLAQWDARATPSAEVSFHPARVVLQDFTGVPAVVDLAAMRDAIVEVGGEPSAINPCFPAELVIDHSVQVDAFGGPDALSINERLEFQRNRERYQLLRWAQTAFDRLRVVPPGTGIVHQVNLEYLARVAFEADAVVYPDTLVGTDSHTTMINGIGVLGWGVGGIEAEAAMLGQPINLLIPQVVGVRLVGALPTGATATDLVLTIAERLRQQGVVGKFVEFFGPGLSALTLADRATIANMSPEFGSTCALFPVDDQTLTYLRVTGRSEEMVQRVEAYYRAQGLLRGDRDPEPTYTEVVELPLDRIEPSVAGPSRPQDRVALRDAKARFSGSLPKLSGGRGKPTFVQRGPGSGEGFELRHGSVVIAAITSCTNTSNPSVMLAAGLLARAARQRGLEVAPWVKTSLAPGSQVVTEYLRRSGLLEDLEALSFHVVGYGCTTCIGNSGPLPEDISEAVKQGELVVGAVLSGNRNFEGRINSDVRANYLASPPLVVAYALAGRLDIDFDSEPLGSGSDGEPVFLKDVWPSPSALAELSGTAADSEMYRTKYADVFTGTERWRSLEVPTGDRFAWDPDSTYIRRPDFLKDVSPEPEPLQDIEGARVLLALGDSVTTDHISPAGSIAKDSPAADYLRSHGVAARDFNSYGSRRGNHEVMVRGTFANVRLRNRLAPGTEGGYTRLLPEGETTSVYEASRKYAERQVPLLVLAGKEYGSGSSRDWAAKGTRMLGVRAVIAESYERIHRSNLVGMGVLPLELTEGNSTESLKLSGEEEYSIAGIAAGLSPGQTLRVVAKAAGGESTQFTVRVRIDTQVEMEYYRHGGILPYALRSLVAGS